MSFGISAQSRTLASCAARPSDWKASDMETFNSASSSSVGGPAMAMANAKHKDAVIARNTPTPTRHARTRDHVARIARLAPPELSLDKRGTRTPQRVNLTKH
jgi:hypothetical protein